MTEFKVSRVLTQKVWDKLNETAVPIVDSNALKELPSIVDSLNSRIKSNQYLPDNVHGYLGLNKGFGVSRFLPIINHIDMAVYYQLCGEIGDRVIEDIDGVFGGWQVVPTPASRAYIKTLPRKKQVDLLYEHEYFSETFSSAAWFQNYKSFTDYIRDLTTSADFGNYVGMTDIANFYDSIDIERLITKIKPQVPDLDRHLEILEVFLRYWNRMLMGYQRSNKGIPQEIISDGSRNLSHFYLHDFDKKMIKYCAPLGVKYVRWADDMLFFAPSPQRIESCLYEASKNLLFEGLNLSAPKTEILTRTEFRNYRCLPLLQAVNDQDDSEFAKQLELIRNMEKRDERVKYDTAIRAVIGYLRRKPHLRTKRRVSYIENSLTAHPEVFSTFNNKQLLASIMIFEDRPSRLNDLNNMANRKSMAAPKANLLKLIREDAKVLEIGGVTKKQMASVIDDIDKSSKKSKILQEFCIPGARQRLIK